MLPNPFQGLPRPSTSLHRFSLSDIDFLELPTSVEAAEQTTDCHSTDGLIAAVAPGWRWSGADPDANRSARLHSYRVAMALRPHQGLVELAHCWSDLSVHLHPVVVQ